MYYRKKGQRIMFQEEELFTYMEKRFVDLSDLMTNGVMTTLILLGGFLLFLLKSDTPIMFLVVIGVPFLLRYPIKRWMFKYLSNMFMELMAIRDTTTMDV